MKLQKQVSRLVGDNEYVKWVIIIPPAQVQQLGWSEGEELESFVEGTFLRITKSTSQKPKLEKMSYAEFKARISELLRSEPTGLSWTEIRQKLRLPQKVPNNLWVRMLMTDTGLIREFNRQNGKTIWKLPSIQSKGGNM